MTYFLKLKLATLFLSVFLLLICTPAYATTYKCVDGDQVIATGLTDTACSLLVDCTCQAETTSSSDTTKLSNPLGDVTPNKLIGKIISAALGIVGSLALLMFIYGGFTWMLASGNAEAVSKGKNILIWATIGLVIIFSSYALVVFVFRSLGLTME